MSSPPLNCFLAAARTASFTASITKSRSMPCSWQRASIFCAILVLMLFGALSSSRASGAHLSLTILSDQVPVNFFAFTCHAKFFFYVHFQIRFRDVRHRNSHSAADFIVEGDIAVGESDDSSTKVPLILDWRARLNLGQMT